MDTPPDDLSDLSEGPAPYTPSSLQPMGARILAFVAILVGGVCGGLIGYGFTDLQCTDDCTTVAGGVGLLGAVLGAVGVGVVALPAPAAMGERGTVAQRHYKNEER